MRYALMLVLIVVLASTPACAIFDTTTEIETSRRGRALANLYNCISAVTVKVLVMCETEHAVVSKHGTGVLIGQRGNTYALVTNRHVIDTTDTFPAAGNVRYNIEHPGVGNVQAQLIAIDEERDLACLTFESARELRVAKFVASVPPLLTDVYHYGYGGLWYKGAFATKGVFSSKSRVWLSLPCAWTVTCNVWYGCSGGGVFTDSGRLMGITSVIDIERHEYLPWLVGVVPYSELVAFLKGTGF